MIAAAVLIGAAVSWVALAGPPHSQVSEPTTPPAVVTRASAAVPPAPREIYFRPQHIGLFAVSTVSALATSVHQLNPREPRWSEPGAFDRRASDKLRIGSQPGETHRATAVLSDVLVFGTLPTAIIATDLVWSLTARTDRRRAHYIIQDIVVVGEATGLTLTTVNVLKVSVARQRPYARTGTQQSPPIELAYADHKDQNVSFPSGHSAMAFAMAVSGASLASMRRYPHWRLAWLSLIPAASVPLLRVASGKHYLSDVLVGSAIGASIGALMPLVVHNPRLRKRKAEVSLGPFQQGAQVGIRW